MQGHGAKRWPWFFTGNEELSKSRGDSDATRMSCIEADSSHSLKPINKISGSDEIIPSNDGRIYVPRFSTSCPTLWFVKHFFDFSLFCARLWQQRRGLGRAELT
jgi:hypothetical protein